MTHNTVLKTLFAGILLAMLLVTAWATLHQPIRQWGGLTGPDRYWTVATLLDAYSGFLTFYAWLAYKESRWLPRIGWFVAIMLLGNIAMSSYMLYQLLRLQSHEGAAALLLRRNA